MGRKTLWPPRVHAHVSGRDRIRVRGIDYWLGPSGSEESRREYARLIAELADPAGKAPKKIGWPKLGALVLAWTDRRMPSCSEKEAAHFKKALAVLLLQDRDQMPADRFKAAQLAEVRAAMVKAGWCRNHVNRQIVRIRTVWRWAEENELAPEGSWNHLRTLRSIPKHDRGVRNTEKCRPAGQEHLDAILPRIRSAAPRAMMSLQWLTGMRSGEVRTMRAGEVDQSGDVWLYRPKAHKNSWRGQARVVPIGPEARKILAPWLTGKKERDHVFLTRNGTRYTSNVYAQCVQRAAHKVGLPWLRPYCFRHGAKQRITREMGLDAARAALGQKCLDTANLYGDTVDLKLATDAVRSSG